MGFDVELWWGLSMAAGLVTIVAWTVHLARHPRGRVSRGLRAWFIGLDGEEVFEVGENESSRVVGALAADSAQALAFCSNSRVPSDRVLVKCGDRAVMLDERGTSIATALVATGPRRSRRVMRILGERRVREWIRTEQPGFSDISDADAAALAVARGWHEGREAMRLEIGGAAVDLGDDGSQALAGLLVAPHGVVNRAAAALGAETLIGWADWLPSHREVRDVRHDHYLDHEVDPWTFGRRPRHGGKSARFRS